MGRSSAVGLALVVSLLVHASGMLLLRRLAGPNTATATAYTLPCEVESPTLVKFIDDTAASRKAPAPIVVAGGPASFSNVDRDVRDGKSGDGASQEAAVLLFPFASDLTLQDTDLNNLERNQIQRIHTARDRATQEERRATPSAGDAVFLASGDIGHHERRKPSRQDSAPGVAAGTQPSTVGSAGTGVSADRRPGAGLPERSAPGAKERHVAQGVLDARGNVAKNSARVAFARPNVDRASAATLAEEQDARIRDDVDAELLAARLQRSIVDASVLSGERLAPGHGGHAGNDHGAGRTTRGEGASALPYAPGAGTDGALDTRDGRYVRWFVEQKARVQAGVVFPFARAIAKDQGTSVYRVVVTRAGTLAGPMHLVRSSGYADFDAAAGAAIRHAAPFAPLPNDLVQGSEELAILIPIAFANPMVE